MINRNFFRFVAGFFGLIFFGLAFVFAAGYYETEVAGKSKAKEIASPADKNSGSVRASQAGDFSSRSVPKTKRSPNWQPEYPPRLE